MKRESPSREPLPSWSRAALLLLAIASVGPGCATSRRTQLQRVAKDWCETIRASQVIPVYPLTEDLQPGDVFLVQRPVAEQHREYEKRGFLPLDEHLERLQPDGYAQFYEHSFSEELRSGTLPGALQRPSTPEGGISEGAWKAAPGAAFPIYSFSVSSGGGLNLAVPIQGVPVGLALLGADAAQGAVALEDVRTLGVGTISLDTQLRGWARRPENRAFLANFGAETPVAFLRVVTRVYVAASVDVSLRASSARSGGLDVGQAAPVDLLRSGGSEESETGAAAAYARGVKSLNGSLSSALGGAGPIPAGGVPVGGSLRVTAASQRAVSMKETFDPPLVFGYLGFDVAILPGGDLGTPIPTLAVLDPDQRSRVRDEARKPFRDREIAITRQVYFALKAVAGDNPEAAGAVAELDALAELVPTSATFYETGRGDVLKQVAWPRDGAEFSTPYLRYRDYRGKLHLSVSVLDRLLGGSKPLSRAVESGATVAVTPDEDGWRELVAERNALRNQLQDPEVLESERVAASAALRALSRLAFRENER